MTAVRQYDQRYFDKWYRHPRFRVKSSAELARQAAFVMRAAEFVLGRPIRTVLDVGCGDGILSAQLADAGVRRVVGLDVDAGVLNRAKARHPGGQAE